MKAAKALFLTVLTIISFEGDEYDVKVAETKKERVSLLEAGFEWIGEDSNRLTYFRKRK